MEKDAEELIQKIISDLGQIDYIHAQDIPDIDLYMDQVTTFMGSRLQGSTRHPQEDKIMTKTMVNNYTKARLLPAPDGKKYTREHLMMLVFIYFFKGVLSISDLQNVLQPVFERYFHKKDGLRLQDIYDEVFGLERERVEQAKADIENVWRRAAQTFDQAPEEDRQDLQLFSFLSMLTFDVFVKKLLIEKAIDTVKSPQGARPEGPQGARRAGRVSKTSPAGGERTPKVKSEKGIDLPPGKC